MHKDHTKHNFVQLNRVSESFIVPSVFSPYSSNQCLNTPFRRDLPQQEPPRPTLRPLSESLSLPQYWGPIDHPTGAAEGSSHKLPTTFV